MTGLIRFIVAGIISCLFATVAIAEFPGAYVGQADARDAAMSPDGKSVVILKSGHLHGVSQLDGWDEIVIKSTANGDVTLTRDEEKWVYAWVDWPFDDLIIANGVSFSIEKRKWVTKSTLIGIDPVTGEERVISASRQRALKDDPKLPKLLGVSRSRREIVLMVPQDSGATDLKAINIDTGKSRVLDSGNERTRFWFLDETLTPVIRVQTSKSGAVDTYYGRATPADKWKSIYRHDRLGTPFYPITFVPDELGFIVLARPEGAERTGLYEFNLQSGAFGKLIKENPRFDLTDAIADASTGDLIYTAHWEDGLKHDWIDPANADRARKISKAFAPNTNWSVIDTDKNRDNWLLYVSSPTRPGDYVVFHAASKKLRKMSKSRPGLTADSVVMPQRFDYTAADGTPLFGYFTPAMKHTGPTSLIVMPHGGPVARDVLDWEPWAQYLSFKGYSVFQPQFRGSGGFGAAFERKGHKEWGAKMQSDITDGIRTLERSGKTSATLPKSIFGASYGGYAALVGATLTPDEFQCAISLNGVSDLPLMLSSYDREDPVESFAYDIWVERMGDPATDLAALKAASPINHIDALKAQVFLIHGNRDEIVAPEQSDKMYRAIIDSGRYAKFMALENVGHSNFREKTSTDVLHEIDRFLTACMPPIRLD